jgi:hypothetical protein
VFLAELRSTLCSHVSAARAAKQERAPTSDHFPGPVAGAPDPGGAFSDRT